MTKWTAADLPDLSGKTVLITGAGGGIGLVTARELARVEARVVLGVRNPAKAQAAIDGMPGHFDVRKLDVSDLSAVREFAETWTGPLDILINNAGVMDVPAARTADGFDVQTATNYFGPFVLTRLLLPTITDRVIGVASQLHRLANLDLEDLDWRTRKYRPMPAYRDSKLAVVLFSLELQRRLTAEGSPVRSVIAHPGIARTNLVAHSPNGAIMRLGPLLNDVENGALPTLFAATQPVPGNAYIGPDGIGGIKGHPKIGRASKAGRDPQTAKTLWQATAKLTGMPR